MVEHLLAARVTSSDETIFGKFFESICKALCKALCGDRSIGIKGIDFVIETESSYEAVTVKSGPNALNSDATVKQAERFKEHFRSLLQTAGFKKQFITTMGCGYGRVSQPNPTAARDYYKLAGQAFWEKLTGSADFYLDLLRLMRDDPDKHWTEFRVHLDETKGRLEHEFSTDFCDASGKILWDKIAELNSAVQVKKPKSRE